MERILIERHGKPVAALVSTGDLARLEEEEQTVPEKSAEERYREALAKAGIRVSWTRPPGEARKKVPRTAASHRGRGRARLRADHSRAQLNGLLVSVYYLDASAAANGYVAERGAEEVLRLLDSRRARAIPEPPGVVEIAAALLGRVRTGETCFEGVRAAVSRLREDLGDVYEIVEVDPVTADRACEVAERHLLGAYGCLQLPTALVLQEQRTDGGLDPLTLASTDRRLNAASAPEGLAVEDPT